MRRRHASSPCSCSSAGPHPCSRRVRRPPHRGHLVAGHLRRPRRARRRRTRRNPGRAPRDPCRRRSTLRRHPGHATVIRRVARDRMFMGFALDQCMRLRRAVLLHLQLLVRVPGRLRAQSRSSASCSLATPSAWWRWDGSTPRWSTDSPRVTPAVRDRPDDRRRHRARHRRAGRGRPCSRHLGDGRHHPRSPADSPNATALALGAYGREAGNGLGVPRRAAVRCRRDRHTARQCIRRHDPVLDGVRDARHGLLSLCAHAHWSGARRPPSPTSWRIR